MSTTIAELRAVVSAETTDATRQMRDFGNTVTDTARHTERELGRLSSLARGDLGGALVGLGAAGAIVTTTAVVGKMAMALDDTRQMAVNLRRELNAYAGGASQATAATDALLRATDNGVTRVDAMAMSSHLLGMGLAKTSDQVYQLARMATLLGDKTISVSERMASWNAMLANQSIERLDTFGISSGRVRTRIEELQAALPGLSREQAFVNAVLEIGGEKLKSVEAAGVVAASSMDKLTAALGDLRQAAADKIHVAVAVDNVTGIIRTLTSVFESTAEQREAHRIDLAISLAKERLADVEASYQRAAADGKYLGETTAGWALEVEKARQALTNAEGALQRVRIISNATAVAVAGAQSAVPKALAAVADAVAPAATGVAEINAALETLRGKESAAQANAVAMAILAGQISQARVEALGLAGAYALLQDRTGGLNGALAGLASAQAKAKLDTVANAIFSGGIERSYVDRIGIDAANKLLLDRQAAAEAAKATLGKATNTTLASDYQNKMGNAIDNIAADYKSALSAAQQASIGLGDLRPGGDNPNAPGRNGAFEDVYRLQAFVNDGSWGDTAAKYGLDAAGATALIQKFQAGMWDASVMAVVDKGKLAKQIQDAQLAKTLMDTVAAELAKETGGDAKIIKAMLGLNNASDSNAGRTKIDLGGQLVPSLAAAIDTELLAKGDELAKRGAASWTLLEGGMLAKAQRSTKFVEMVASMVDNALANYIPAQ